MLCFQLQKILKAQNLPVWSIRKTHKADTKPGRDRVILYLNILLRARQKRKQLYPKYLKTRTAVLSIHKEKSVLSEFGFGKQ